MDTSVLIWTALSTVFLAIAIKFVIRRLSHRYPPGPWNLPIFGYLPFLSGDPSKDYMKLMEKYGPIFGLRLGARYTVVLNDFQAMKEAFNKEEFLDRPPGWFEISDKFNHVANMNGLEWKETRKLMFTTLRKLGVGKNKIEERILEEVSQLITLLKTRGPEAEINLLDVIYLPLLNVIMTITCGRPFDDGDLLLKALAQYNSHALRVILNNHKSAYYPFLKPLIWIKKLFIDDIPFFKEMEEFVRKETEEHEKEFDENNLEDFLSYYIKDMRASQNTTLNYANLQGNSQFLLFAGTDTTRTATTWVFLHLAQHQVAQEKVYQEIVRVYGKEKMPEWSDRDDLPYTTAFILESARLKALASAEDPHWSSKDSEIGGYFIPKNSMILGNVLAVHMDKELWGDPENFRPERFLSQDGKKAIKPEYWVPFLTGKRACPGAKLANMQIFLFVTSLVQRFRVVPPKSGLSLDPNYFIILFPKKPIMSFEPRL